VRQGVTKRLAVDALFLSKKLVYSTSSTVLKNKSVPIFRVPTASTLIQCH
jgi:hypothetical protein